MESRWKLFLLIAVLTYVAFVARYGSIEGFICDRQRAAIQASADRFVATQKWHEAADYLLDCLKKPLPAETRSFVQLRLLDCWIHLAEIGNEMELATLLSNAEVMARSGVIDQPLD